MLLIELLDDLLRFDEEDEVIEMDGIALLLLLVDALILDRVIE